MGFSRGKLSNEVLSSLWVFYGFSKVPKPNPRVPTMEMVMSMVDFSHPIFTAIFWHDLESTPIANQFNSSGS